ncbi:hypothetical protein [Fibrobacter sp. UWB5]|uniref:hypothetical protein n=1 Tax=Fibrobacter sp. UWB5 TaxID=1964360 RepID=UPI000B51EF64|nr:hypothetical protein [Fibrobacter sp. UWB5]
MKKIIALLVFALFACVPAWSQMEAAIDPTTGAATGTSAGPLLNGIRTPLIVGGALGFGSGTGVGSDRGIGLRQIEPMIGIWYPGLALFRVGYGMYGYEEDADDGKDYQVDHSEMDFELGLHLLGEVYLLGSYSRVKELSDLGDVAWNEWGAGFGSLLFIFSKTMLFAEVAYRWVLTHYDPFLDKKVHGGRIQMNLGFSVYVF